MIKELLSKKIDVNEEGYLEHFDQWDRQIGIAIAEEEGIAMTDRHWEIISYLQNEFQKGEALSIRKIKNSDVVSIKEFYDLFPGGPLKKATKIAGIPKPASCV